MQPRRLESQPGARYTEPAPQASQELRQTVSDLPAEKSLVSWSSHRPRSLKGDHRLLTGALKPPHEYPSSSEHTQG